MLSSSFQRLHEYGEDDDNLLVQSKEQTHLHLDPSKKKEVPLSRRKQRELQRQTKAAALKRNLGHNERYTFDEEGNPVKVCCACAYGLCCCRLSRRWCVCVCVFLFVFSSQLRLRFVLVFSLAQSLLVLT